MDIDIDDLFDAEPAENNEAEEENNPLFSDEQNNEADVGGEQPKKTDDVDVDVASAQPKKKRVLKPQPKLDGDRLCGPRGIPILEKTFADVKFKGKGYEREDLKLLMSKMEHWAHRMMPKMPFDNALERIEKLGKGKQVHVNLRKLRMGMDIMPAIIPEDDDVARGDDDAQVDAFDELIGAAAAPPSPMSPRSDEGGAEVDSPPSPSRAQSQQRPDHDDVTMTEEQLERMRRNREAAQLRRAQFQQRQRAAEQGAGSAGVSTALQRSTPDENAAAPGQLQNADVLSDSEILNDVLDEDEASSRVPERLDGGDNVGVENSRRNPARSRSPSLELNVQLSSCRRSGSPNLGSIYSASASDGPAKIPFQSAPSQSSTSGIGESSQPRSQSPTQSQESSNSSQSHSQMQISLSPCRSHNAQSPSQSHTSPSQSQSLQPLQSQRTEASSSNSKHSYDKDAICGTLVMPSARGLHTQDPMEVSSDDEESIAVERGSRRKPLLIDDDDDILDVDDAVELVGKQAGTCEGLGHLHQMSETQVGQGSSAGRLGHCHEMSETQVDQGPTSSC